MEFIIAFLVLGAVVFCNALLAIFMEDAAKKKGYSKDAHAFALCFWLGIFGCFYVMALPDLKQRQQSSASSIYHDVAWKMEELTAEATQKDGSAEAYLREVGMTPEEYSCKSLAVFGEDSVGECEMCKKTQKTRKHCGIRRNNTFSNISVCADCINVFAEYNPNAVFDLEIKKPN